MGIEGALVLEGARDKRALASFFGVRQNDGHGDIEALVAYVAQSGKELKQ